MNKISIVPPEEKALIQEKGVATFTSFFKDKRIIVIFKNGEQKEYNFNSNYGYTNLTKFLRALEEVPV